MDDQRRKLLVVNAANPSLRLSVAPPVAQPQLRVTTAPAQRLYMPDGQNYIDRSPDAVVNAPKQIRELPKLNFAQRFRDTFDANTESDRIKRLNAGQNEVYTQGNALAQVGKTFLGGFDKTRTAIDALTGHLDREAAELDEAYRTHKITLDQYRLALQKQAERTAFAGTGYNKDGTKQGFGDRFLTSAGVGIEGGLDAVPFVGGAGKLLALGGAKIGGTALAANAAENAARAGTGAIVKTGARIGAGYGGTYGFANSIQGGDNSIKKTAIETGVGAGTGGVVGAGGGFLGAGFARLFPQKPVDASITRYLANETDPNAVKSVLSGVLNIGEQELGDISQKVAESTSKRGVNSAIKSFIKQNAPAQKLFNDLARETDPAIVKETLGGNVPDSIINTITAENNPISIGKILRELEVDPNIQLSDDVRQRLTEAGVKSVKQDPNAQYPAEYQDGNITVRSQEDLNKNIYHELGHQIYNTQLTPEEKALFKGEGAASKEAVGRPGYTQDNVNAEDFADYLNKALSGQIKDVPQAFQSVIRKYAKMAAQEAEQVTQNVSKAAEQVVYRTDPRTGQVTKQTFDDLINKISDLRAIPIEQRTAAQATELDDAIKGLKLLEQKQAQATTPETQLEAAKTANTGTGAIDQATAQATGETPAKGAEPSTAGQVSTNQGKVAGQVSDAATVRTSDGRTAQDLIDQARAQEVEYIGAIRRAAAENNGEVTDKAIKNAVKTDAERINQKILEKDGRAPTDLLRSTILTADPASSVDGIVASLQRDGYTVWVDPRTGLADLTNRYAEGAPGYRDIAIKFVKGDGDNLVKELQITTPNMAQAKSEFGGHKLYKQVRAKVGDWEQAEKDMMALYERANQLDAAALNSASETSVPVNALPKGKGTPEAVYPATSSPSNTTLTGSSSTMKNRGNLVDDSAINNDSLSGNSILKDQPPVKNISDSTRPAGFAESLSQTSTPESVYRDLLEIQTKPNPNTFAQASQDIVNNEQAITQEILGKAKGTLNDVDNARALLLLDKAIAEDNIPLAQRLAAKINSSGTENARAVQILSAVNKTTPAGALREVDKIVAEAQEKGLLPKDFVLDPAKINDIIDQANYIQTLEMGTRDHDIAVALLAKQLNDIVPPKIGDKLNSLVNISLLLNPKTFIRNVIGNTAGAAAETVSSTIATPIDMLVSLRTGNRTVALPSVIKRFGGFGEGFRQGFQETNLGIRIGTGGKYDLNTPALQSKFGQWIEKALGHSLSDTDKAFAMSQYADTLNSLMKAQKVTKPTQEMIDIASQEALYATYQGDSFIAKSLQGAKGWLNKANIKGFGLGDVVVRYPKTPGNLVAVGMDYSPYGFLKGLWQFAKLNEGSTLAAQRAAVRNLGRGITGTGLIAGGYYLAKNNIITAKKSSDKDLNSLQRQQGQPPFSFNITALGRLLRGEDTKAREGDVVTTYDWLQPNAIQLSMGANIALNKGQGANDWISTTLDQAATGLETIQEQPVLAQTGKFFKTAATPADQGGGIPNAIVDAVTGTPSMLVPSVLNQTAGVIDNTARSTYDPNPIKEGYNKVVAKIPGASKTLQPVVDTFGNEVKRQQTDNPLTRIFNSFANPAFVTKIQRTPEGQMVLDIYNNSGETQQIPRVAARKQMVNTDGGEGSKAESYTLSAKQMTEFQKLTGKLAKDTFAELANNPSFMALSDTEKAKVMGDKLTDINSFAKMTVLGNKPKTMSEGVKTLASGNLASFSSKTPENVDELAKQYYQKTAYMDKETYKKWLNGAPDEVATATAAELNKSRPKNTNEIPAYNGLAKRYAEYQKSIADAKKDGSWSKLDEVKKNQEFWKGAIKDSRENLTKDIYDAGSSGAEDYWKKGYISKEDIDKAVQLDNELYASGLSEKLKFSKKFRNAYGYGVPTSPDGSSGGSGGKGGKGKSAKLKTVAGLNEPQLRFNPPAAPDIKTTPTRAKGKFKFNVPASVQVSPVRLKL